MTKFNLIFIIDKWLGHPIRRKGINNSYTVCRICKLNIPDNETYPSYIIKYGLKRRGIINAIYRKIFKLNNI